ncbi:S24/S26 family peptidase [Virgisporangium aurantiacum]|uniref:Peptidase S26 domain-containing protein n=1 Tax=Virgisporangium aurantiacum TaxID=175570 RepID=A0A8J4E840_9ACTN|nr:S24/S26 family peptidase [Virgisporangium aurantiacum]GIJ64959.1 hypothetical protein Vau01_124750 [Virgisporangium aurantiacum]
MSLAAVLSSLAVVGLAALMGGAAKWLRRRSLVAVVTGDSMLPTYRSGDRVLVWRAPLGAVRPGQVVVIEQDPAEVGPDDPRSGPHLMIKRAVALPGDRVPSGCLFVLGGQSDGVI